MWCAFDLVMRIISSLLGLAMAAMGSVWMLQGLNIAFRRGFMVGDHRSAITGAVLELFGVGQVVLTNTRRTRV